MTVPRELYSEIKHDLQKVATPLFDLGEQHVRKRGAFLPFGATLKSDGEVNLQAAVPENEPATSDDVLPVLLEGLSLAAVDVTVIAVAAADWVQIAEPGQSLQPAIKVQVHHRRGLAVTFYVPATKRILRGWQFGDTIVRRGEPLVASWPATGESGAPTA